MRRRLLAAVLTLAIVLACSEPNEDRKPEQARGNALSVSSTGTVPQKKDLRGRWVYHEEDVTMVFEFTDTKVIDRTEGGDAGDSLEYVILGDTVIVLGGGGMDHFLYRGDSLLLQSNCKVKGESGEKKCSLASQFLAKHPKAWRRMPR